MIELAVVLAEYVGIPSFMVGVADGAVHLCVGRQTTVKTHRRLNVFANLCMTVDAQFTLSGIAKGRVTQAALSLDFGMRCDDVTWHQQPFLNFIGFDRVHHKQQQQKAGTDGESDFRNAAHH